MAGKEGWPGAVQPLMVNLSGNSDAIDSCGDATQIPVLQDNIEGDMWSAFGAKYNTILVVDQEGVVQHAIYPSSFPEAEAEIVDVVEALLQ